jgi:hypothetical protein
MRPRLSMPVFTLALAAACIAGTPSLAAEVVLRNPYENVNWQTFNRYRADLHVHTLQSDGCHSVDEVVRTFHDAGFSILAITDHDAMAPNFCRTRDASLPKAIAFGAFADQPTPYPDPRPPNFPANPTWPWSDFGAPSPADLGMLGIQAAELTCTYHVGSLFSDYGIRPPCPKAGSTLDDELGEVARRGGLAILNHPDTRQPPEWFVKLYRDHSAESFVGVEIGADEAPTVDAYVTVWDQVLGELMPDRPVWGFGTSDMHVLTRTRFAFTVLLLDGLTTQKVKEAMRHGQFYAVVWPKMLNLSRQRGHTHDGPAAYEGTYPELHSVAVDRSGGKISIDAGGYDEIVWISEPAHDSNPKAPWLSGEIVQRGPVFDYANSNAALNYVRAELVRHTDNGPVRVFLNPFGLVRPRPKRKDDAEPR